MPNNINNYLSVQGNPTEIDEFFKKAASGTKEFGFEPFVPLPVEKIKSDWDIIDLWGTDRNCYSIKLEIPNVYFQTAYCFPSAVLLAMSIQFPSLVFTDQWVDEYTENLGIVVCKNGECSLLEEDTIVTGGEQNRLNFKVQAIA